MTGPGAVNADVRTALQAACAALTAAGMGVVADTARQYLTPPAGSICVVVAGERARGKSSLVNALLACPGASPVGATMAPWAFLRFIPPDTAATDETDSYASLFTGFGVSRTIRRAEVRDWVIEDGCHVSDSGIDALPTGAEVAIGGGFLPDVALIDTPPRGLWNPVRLRLRTTPSTRATVVVLVCDAREPITSTELEFLDSVGGQVAAVVIAATKIDLNPNHWRALVDEHRRLLHERAPDLADTPIFGVSSNAAFSALTQSPAGTSGPAMNRSGLPAFVQHLAAICARHDTLHAVKGLGVARAGLDSLVAQHKSRRLALIGGEAALAQAAAELRALEHNWDYGLTGDTGPPPSVLRDELDAAHRMTLRAFDRRSDALTEDWAGRLSPISLDAVMRAPQRLAAELTADVEVLMAEVSDEFITALAAVLQRLGLPADLTPVADPRSVPAAVGSSGTCERILASLRTSAAAIVDGAEDLRGWMDRAIAVACSEEARDILDETNRLQPVIISEYHRYLTESKARVKSLIASYFEAGKSCEAHRVKTAGELDATLVSLAATIAAVDAQLARFPHPASPGWTTTSSGSGYGSGVSRITRARNRTTSKNGIPSISEAPSEPWPTLDAARGDGKAPLR